jgi:hypothetical protein
MWDLWWTNWHWDRFFSEYFGFPLSVSFHQCSITRKNLRSQNYVAASQWQQVRIPTEFRCDKACLQILYVIHIPWHRLIMLYLIEKTTQSIRNNHLSLTSLWMMRTNTFFSNGATAPSGPRPLHYRGFTISLRHTPQSVGLLWTRDQPDAETSTWYHTTLTRDRHPCPPRDSNPQYQKASGHRPTP